MLAEAGRRRAFAVISHPDAGKSTLTEALALHASAITHAGAVHGKAGLRGVTSDWMAMERARGISITSAALRFDYRDMVLNLLDTPGHADFSEDTYRVLSAVDGAIMLLDSAKGLEPQTLKLFDVCRSRGVPVITFVNKWDRPGREPLELLDEIEQRIGLRPAPVNWPVGVAGDFRGLIERATGGYTTFTRTPGGAGRALETRLDAAAAADREGMAYAAAREELALLDEIYGPGVDMASFLAGVSSPVLFGAALPNFGVRRLLDVVIELAPPPAAREDAEGEPRHLDAPFSGLVFKVQANMDPAHRDRMAFVRVCSGRFERGMVLTHTATGRPFATKYAQSMFGQDRETVEEAFPGDVIGLVNATALRPGDTLYAGAGTRSSSRPSRASRPSTSRWSAARRRARPSSSGAGSSSSIPRASSRSSPQTCAATRPRCSPPSVRCSSTWCGTGSSTSSALARNSITSTTRWPGGPMPRAPGPWLGSAPPRC